MDGYGVDAYLTIQHLEGDWREAEAGRLGEEAGEGADLAAAEGQPPQALHA
jgi:hypothetical protein